MTKQRSNLTRIILYSTFLFLPLLVTPFTFELFEFPKIIFLYTFATFIASIWFYRAIEMGRITFPKTSLDRAIFLIFISTLISTIFALDTTTALLGYYTRFTGGIFSVIGYIIFFYAASLICRNRESARRLLILLITSTSIVTLYALTQRLGIDKDFWVQKSNERVFSTLGQPNWLAAYLAAVIPISLSFALIQVDKTKKVILLILTILFSSALAFTLSLAGYLGLSLALLLHLLINYKGPSFHKNLLIILIIAGVILLVPSTIQKLPERTRETGIIRTLVWFGSVDTFRGAELNRKLIGYGPGNFAYAFPPFRPSGLNYTSEWDFLFNKPHNEVLDLLINQGLSGVAVYAFLILVVIMFFMKRIAVDKENRLILSGLFSGWLSLLVTSFFGFLVTPTTFLFWTLPAIGIGISGSNELRSLSLIDNIRTKKLLQLSVIIFSSYILMNILTLLVADINYARGYRLANIGLKNQAAKAVEAAIRQHPQEPRYQATLARIYSQSARKKGSRLGLDGEKIERAEAAVRKSLDLNSKHSLILRSSIYSFYDLGRLDSKYYTLAEDVVNDAIRFIPTDPTLRVMKAKILIETGRKEEAGETLEEALRLKNNHPEARLLLEQIKQN